jgi:hypothetical protein
MSFTLSVTGKSSILTTNYSPTLELDVDYECALLHFSTFNSIPNVNKHNNKFYYDDNEVIEIPEGAYELQDIYDYLKHKVKNCVFKLFCNNNTLKATIFCTKDIHFEKPNSIGELLGYGKAFLKSHKLYESPLPVNILSTTVVRIECDIISGSYINGQASHIIHEFAPNVPPGYRIIEIPKNTIYFKVNRENINCINIRILDINNNIIDFRGEEVNLYLHLRKHDRLQ